MTRVNSTAAHATIPAATAVVDATTRPAGNRRAIQAGMP